MIMTWVQIVVVMFLLYMGLRSLVTTWSNCYNNDLG
jgi:hypothetical protein